MSGVKVSAVIPTKNRSKELQRAIHSVLKQTHQEFEILVVDDHSEENILEMVDSFKDARIKYFKSNKIPSNANVCRNIGIQNAKGEYIAMLDSDDEWFPKHLESKLIFLLDNEADGVFGSYLIDDGENRKEVISRVLKPYEKMLDYILTDGRTQTSTYLFKSDKVKSIQWDENLNRHQDYDFSVRFANKNKFIACPEVSSIVHWKKGEKRMEDFASQIYFIQKHEANMSGKVFNYYHQNFDKQLAFRTDVSKDIKNYFKKNKFKYIHDVSLNEFLGAQNKAFSKVVRLFLRVKYVLLVIFKV